MATVEEIVKDLLGSFATDIGGPAAAKWIDNRYQELVSRIRFRHLRQVGELVIPGNIDTGTLAITRGSTAVTGTSTTFETEVGSTGDQEYWWIRPSVAWYKVASIEGEEGLTFASAFSETTVTAASYKLVRRHHALDANARWLGDTAIHMRTRLPIAVIAHDELSMLIPGRTITGSYPRVMSQVGVDSNGYLMVEVYPPPENSEIIYYIFWDLPTALTMSSTIPKQIDAYVLKEGAMIDLCRYEKVKLIQAGSIEAATVFRNDEMKYTTAWDKRVMEASRTQRGVDDISLILQTARRGSWPLQSGDYRTARDMVMDRSWENL